MAEDGRRDGGPSSPGSGRGIGGASSRPALETRATSDAHRVRFSQDFEGQDAGYFPQGQTHDGAHGARIETATGGNDSSGVMSPTSFHSAQSASSPTSPTSPRTRDRGYSLRRTLFTRNATQRSDHGGQNEVELTPSVGSGRVGNDARIVEEGQGGWRKRDRANTKTSDGSGKSEADSSVSDRKKASAGASKGEAVLPNFYASLSVKKSKLHTLGEKLAQYQTDAANFIFRRKPIPPSKDGRHIDLDASRKDDLIDERTGKPYIGNTIRSSRYTLWDFIPRQLFFQFSKLANAYFLVVGILQLIPGLSTIGSWTTIAPLCVFVALSMAKEGYDDVRRYNLDQVENKKVSQVFQAFRPLNRGKSSKLGLRSAKNLVHPRKGVKLPDDDRSSTPSGTLKLWASVKWKYIKVGDIIRVERNEDIPADIVLFHATGPNGIAYIDTMALDGETNLKSKQASPCLSKRCNTLDGVAACRAKIVVEDPNIDLYNFDGKVSVEDETLPLTTNEVVFRGSTLRNTSHAIGMVINTGEDCKIRMNANKNPRIKTPGMQILTNKIVVLLVVFTLLLSGFCTLGYELWKRSHEREAWYLKNATVPFAQIIVGYIILYNTLIPLSLYVSLEIIKVGQLILMGDVEMYDPVSNTPMVCNTTTILENLGQVGYVFSDKTGTLTDNVMRFRKFSVAGYAWLHDLDLQKDAAYLEQKLLESKRKKKGKGQAKSAQKKEATEATVGRNSIAEGRPSTVRRSSSIWRSSARPEKQEPEFKTEELLQYLQNKPHSVFTKKAKFFILAIALCHTCLPETQEDGEIEFQAASPDELALVKAAQDLGWLVIDRPSQSIVLKYPGRPDSFEVITETYQVLDVIEFSSKRKRMSIIIRFPNGKICMFCKGADSAILPRLKLASLAMQKVSEISRQASKRKSIEAEEHLRRMSSQNRRDSYNRHSIALSHSESRKSTGAGRPSLGAGRPSMASGKLNAIQDDSSKSDSSPYQSARSSLNLNRDSYDRRISTQTERFDDSMIDESVVLDDAQVFERCFQHIDDFATEGLRTLLFGHKFVDEEDYNSWKKIYADATTSLVDRQERIEAAGEMIEDGFELTGATAIEDKLQKGVPETIDKLRRANIKIWMLTGDKRETAINIAHSARIAKAYSEVIILDHTQGDVEQRMATAFVDISNGSIAHSVIVVDGQTLAAINNDEKLAVLFFNLVVATDSVICCRASPSQKAYLVRQIRLKVKHSMTLSIGDGANDIAMIQEAHVGVGVSGKEGLQAARTSDYAIAQFRFLQRLLFVHGRWNYVRTGKYILATFWKELLFYMVQASYQRWNGYSGTSLFESTSLTVFNSLFTSLAVVLLGMFEQDLDALTLLAVPELYSYGQTNQAFNFKKYIAWMFMAVSDAMIIYFTMWGLWQHFGYQDNGDLLSLGTLCFAVSVMFINIKCLIIEVHNKTIIPIAGCLITITGWWIWTVTLSGLYSYRSKARLLYNLRGGFIYHYGRDVVWWLILILSLSAVIVFELSVQSIRKVYFPDDTDVFQVLQKDPAVRQRFQEILHHEEEGSALTQADDERAGEASGVAEAEIQKLLDERPDRLKEKDEKRLQDEQDTAIGQGEKQHHHHHHRGHGRFGLSSLGRKKNNEPGDVDDIEMTSRS